jgi:hypothetical protein
VRVRASHYFPPATQFELMAEAGPVVPAIAQCGPRPGPGCAHHQRIQLQNHKVLSFGPQVPQPLELHLIHDGGMEYTPEERHEQQDKKGRIKPGRSRPGKTQTCLYLSAEQMLHGGAEGTRYRSGAAVEAAGRAAEEPGAARLDCRSLAPFFNPIRELRCIRGSRPGGTPGRFSPPPHDHL